MGAQAELNLSISHKTNVLSVLARRVGVANGIHVADLAAICQLAEREVRKAVSELREEGVAVCAQPATGYFIAGTPEELEESCQFLRGRAMHSLRLESRLRNIPLPDLLGQLHLPT